MKVLTAWFTLLLVSLLMLPSITNAAAPQIQLFLDGKPLLAEVSPRIVNDNTIVPVRIIAESIGSRVSWDEKERKVTINKDATNIQLFIDKTGATVNSKAFQLETAPTIIDGNTMLPLRFVSEQLGVKVTWDDLTKSVFLYKPQLITADKTEIVEKKPDLIGGNPIAGNPLPSNTIPSSSVPGGTTPSSTTPNSSVQGNLTPSSSTPSSSTPSNSITSNTAANNAASTNPVGGNSITPGQQLPKFDQPASSIKAGETVKAGDSTDPKLTDNTSVSLTGVAQTGSVPTPPATADKKPTVAIATVQSISLKGDTFSIKAKDNTLKPNIFYLSNPERIILDFPNSKLDEPLYAKLNPQGEGALPDKSEQVSQIRYSLFSKEPSIVRIVIDLPQKSEIKLTDVQQNGELSGKISPGKSLFKVVIDPGHGGKDTGAISVTKRYEKDFVLSLGKKVTELLQKEPKIETVMTRSDDTFIELADRAGKANELGADLFVSIHGNSASKESIRGTETYYYTDQSEAFANLMHKYLLDGTGFPDRRVKQERFYVVRNTNMPSVLLEIGFLSNREEESLMFQDAHQNQVAASIVAAIKKQLNLD